MLNHASCLAEMPAPESSRGWRAALALRFARMDAHTRIVHREHEGPLMVQKALYPEGPTVCQAVIVHPPGGIAGGDTLEMQLQIDSDAHAQLITPGAAKWYRGAGRDARQSFVAALASGAVLEWLPHEAILFDGAQARSHSRIELEGSAVAIIWDIVCLGRTASGERFSSGHLHQKFAVIRDGALIWVEQNVIGANGTARRALAGLHGKPVFGTLIIAAPLIENEWLALARGVGLNLASDIALNLACEDRAVTRVPGVLIARCRADTAVDVRTWFTLLWSVLRPLVIGRQVLTPRLWST